MLGIINIFDSKQLKDIIRPTIYVRMCVYVCEWSKIRSVVGIFHLHTY